MSREVKYINPIIKEVPDLDHEEIGELLDGEFGADLVAWEYYRLYPI